MVVGALGAPTGGIMEIASAVGHLSLVPRFAGLVITVIISERIRE
jgi:hypothetical protein